MQLRSLATIEFLVDAEDRRRAWFIEANPRLQVEHTVTEEVTGLDLVQLQLRLAAGESLGDLGLQPHCRQDQGYAVQLRVNLEPADPNATPGGGDTLTLYEPPSGPGVRVDGCGFAGYGRARPTTAWSPR